MAQTKYESFRARAIGFFIVAGADAAYIVYKFATQGSTTGPTWIFLVLGLLGGWQYLKKADAEREQDLRDLGKNSSMVSGSADDSRK